jgi:hypothetical protein
MKVGDLVRITTNPKKGVGIIVEKTVHSNREEPYVRYRIMWSNGHVTVGGKYFVEVINESR